MPNPHTELIELQCGKCGVWHAIPKAIHATCVEEGGFWHCPNGHSWGYREGRREREAVRRERDQLKQRVAQLDDTVAAERRAREDAETKLRTVKRRAVAGVCPCCNRTFQNVQRHMKSKHPNVVPLEQKTAS